jgi:hypothetical protein
VDIDPYRLTAFLHVVLFAYWLGADLGVFICGRLASRPNLTPDTRQMVRRVGQLIDMGPRTALVLMVPAGLILASQYGSPIVGTPLVLVCVASLAWLWMVWAIFRQPHTPMGKTLWKIDLALRAALTLSFIGFGVSTWVTGEPIAFQWLAAKIVVFGLILLDGIILRLVLYRQEARGGKPSPTLQRALISAVLLIWLFVATAAFLGVVKPF